MNRINEFETVLSYLGFPGDFKPVLYENEITTRSRSLTAGFSFEFDVDYDNVATSMENLRKAVRAFFEILENSDPIKNKLEDQQREIQELRSRVEELVQYKTYFEKAKELK